MPSLLILTDRGVHKSELIPEIKIPSYRKFFMVFYQRTMSEIQGDEIEVIGENEPEKDQ